MSLLWKVEFSSVTAHRAADDILMLMEDLMLLYVYGFEGRMWVGYRFSVYTESSCLI